MGSTLAFDGFVIEVVPVPGGTHALCALVVAHFAIMGVPCMMVVFHRAFAYSEDLLLISARGAIADDRTARRRKLAQLSGHMLPLGLRGLRPAGAHHHRFFMSARAGQ